MNGGVIAGDCVREKIETGRCVGAVDSVVSGGHVENSGVREAAQIVVVEPVRSLVSQLRRLVILNSGGLPDDGRRDPRLQVMTHCHCCCCCSR